MSWQRRAVVAAVLACGLGCAPNNDQFQKKLDELEKRLTDVDTRLSEKLRLMDRDYAAQRLSAAQRKLLDAAVFSEATARVLGPASPQYSVLKERAARLRQSVKDSERLPVEDRYEFIRKAEEELADAEKLLRPTGQYDVHFKLDKSDLAGGLTEGGRTEMERLRGEVKDACHHLNTILVIGYACDKDDSPGKGHSVKLSEARAQKVRDAIQETLKADRTCPTLQIDPVAGGVIVPPDSAVLTPEKLEAIRAEYRVAAVYLVGPESKSPSPSH